MLRAKDPGRAMDRTVTYPKTVNPAIAPMEDRTCYNMNPCSCYYFAQFQQGVDRRGGWG